MHQLINQCKSQSLALYLLKQMRYIYYYEDTIIIYLPEELQKS